MTRLLLAALVAVASATRSPSQLMQARLAGAPKLVVVAEEEQPEEERLAGAPKYVVVAEEEQPEEERLAGAPKHVVVAEEEQLEEEQPAEEEQLVVPAMSPRRPVEEPVEQMSQQEVTVPEAVEEVEVIPPRMPPRTGRPRTKRPRPRGPRPSRYLDDASRLRGVLKRFSTERLPVLDKQVAAYVKRGQKLAREMKSLRGVRKGRKVTLRKVTRALSRAKRRMRDGKRLANKAVALLKLCDGVNDRDMGRAGQKLARYMRRVARRLARV